MPVIEDLFSLYLVWTIVIIFRNEEECSVLYKYSRTHTIIR